MTYHELTEKVWNELGYFKKDKIDSLIQSYLREKADAIIGHKYVENTEDKCIYPFNECVERSLGLLKAESKECEIVCECSCGKYSHPAPRPEDPRGKEWCECKDIRYQENWFCHSCRKPVRDKPEAKKEIEKVEIPDAPHSTSGNCHLECTVNLLIDHINGK